VFSRKEINMVAYCLAKTIIHNIVLIFIMMFQYVLITLFLMI